MAGHAAKDSLAIARTTPPTMPRMRAIRSRSDKYFFEYCAGQPAQLGPQNCKAMRTDRTIGATS
jgi:hypothetical protein